MKTKKNQRFFISQKPKVSKKLILITILILMVSTVSALTGHIYHQVNKEDDVEILITYFNQEDYKAKDLKVSAYLPDFYAQRTGLKIKSGESGRRVLYLETRNINSGYHPLIIRTMNDEGIREKRHTWVYIE